MHVPPLVQDLALMLLVAGVITIIFKKFNLPLVLGYIVTGFLVGPYFSFFPGITDMTSVETWSEIGIIILMFSLGLEFNLLKLFSVGKTAVISAVTEVVAMFALGILFGNLLGFTTMGSVFLGCMLSMSSTTIIIKAFEDLKLKEEKFTNLVFGTLIIEDIAGILMMVVFSTLAVSQGISGGEMTMSLLKMGFYLAMWLILGILIIPTFIKKAEKLMSDETLMIVSIGICFGMVLLSHYLGFSSALGAFLAGSLLAGTTLSERIERVTKPNKDLFGAIFFISVGTMVDPAQVGANIGTIIILTLVTIIGKALFSTIGVYISGLPLKTAMQCGFSLAQIGEFSFIIASLGISLGLIDSDIYPIIVTVSVITTFTTPFVIKYEGKVYNLLEKILPLKFMDRLNRSNPNSVEIEQSRENLWSQFLKTYLPRLVVQVIIIMGITMGATMVIWPFLMSFMNNNVASVITTVLVIGISAPFLKQTSVQRNKYYWALWFKNKATHFTLALLALVSIVLMMALIVFPMQTMLNLSVPVMTVATFLIVSVIIYSDSLVGLYQKIENLFFSNLGADTSKKKETMTKPLKKIKDKTLPITMPVAEFYYDRQSHLPGRRISDILEKAGSGVKVIGISRGGKNILMPNKKRRLIDGDDVFITGTKEQIDEFFVKTGWIPEVQEQTEKRYMDFDDFLTELNNERKGRNLVYRAFEVKENSVFCGMNVKDSRLSNKHHDMLLLLQRNNKLITQPDEDFELISGDKLWLLGVSDRGRKKIPA